MEKVSDNLAAAAMVVSLVLGVCIVLVTLVNATVRSKDKHIHHHIHISDSQMLDEFINVIHKYLNKPNNKE